MQQEKHDIIAAALGASFALSRREKTTRTEVVKFFVQVVGLARRCA